MDFFRKLTFAAFALLSVLALLAMRPIPTADLANCETISGVVASVSSGASADIIITLEHSNRVFYINRGQERGFDPERIRERILNKQVTLYFPKYWTPLDPTASLRHLTGIKMNDQLLFSEEARC